MASTQIAFQTAFQVEIFKTWGMNITEVIEAAQKVPIPIWLSMKIENESARSNIGSSDDILKELCNGNKFAARLFCKDPLKQNFAEKFQLEWMKSHGIPDIYTMSSGGKNAYYLVDGEIKSGLTKKPSGSNATKSFDFRSHDHDMWCYVKYTNEEGGAQDNQHADGQKFIEQSVKFLTQNPQITTQLVFVADGAYYNEKRREHIRQIIPTQFQDRVKIYRTDELCHVIQA